MCGICGEFGITDPPSLERVADLTHLMRRRGPDDEGLWTDDTHCALGFRRLSILDLSPAAHQPMLTPDGRYVLVFNGEVYNFGELRAELEQRGWRFRSTGDAEVVLCALAEWGIKALERFNGMFALAFYDTLEKTLLLARDHAGIKPLYYARAPQGLIFASQYDQIIHHPWTRGFQVSGEALHLYLGLGYIPSPYALLDNTHMLEAGTWLQVDSGGRIRQGRFFEFPQYAEPTLHGQEAYEAVHAAVVNAVRRQMISDVPIGAFLSGGIDSPLVTAVMQAISDQPITAFSMKTDDPTLDESGDASAYAEQFGVEHVLEEFSAQDALDYLSAVVSASSEPFGDYSIFPTMLIAKLARSQVTVMLSGDGGDELFWGYPGRFISVLKSAQAFRKPHPVRIAEWGVRKVFGFGSGSWNAKHFATVGQWYQAKHIHNHHISQIFPGLPGWPKQYGTYHYSGHQVDEVAQWMRWNEFVGHLERVLLKVDRASMYHSLEVRVPLLDREVIDVALKTDWRDCLDIDQQIGKLPLRRALARYSTYQTLQKRGFSVPMDSWLRGSLRPVFEEEVLAQPDLFGFEINRQHLTRIFENHLRGDNYGWGLWILLSLALWKRHHYQNAMRSTISLQEA